MFQALRAGLRGNRSHVPGGAGRARPCGALQCGPGFRFCPFLRSMGTHGKDFKQVGAGGG